MHKLIVTILFLLRQRKTFAALRSNSSFSQNGFFSHREKPVDRQLQERCPYGNDLTVEVVFKPKCSVNGYDGNRAVSLIPFFQYYRNIPDEVPPTYLPFPSSARLRPVLLVVLRPNAVQDNFARPFPPSLL